MSDPLIHLSGVARSYSVGKTAVAALAGINLAIARGEFTALVGPSGSGKSTLLNLIGGLDRPSSGGIRVDGLDLEKAPEPQLDRQSSTRDLGFECRGEQLSNGHCCKTR